MALSTRDVMFALRAQDFASRRIGAVGSAFNRLGKQMEASKARADEAAKSLQKAADQRIQPLKDANTQLARQNETMKKQVAGIKENTRVTRSNLAASKSRLDAENALLKTQSQGHKSVIDQARSSNQAIREGMKLDKQRSDARIAGVRQANQLTGQQIQQQRAQIAQITRQSQGIIDGYKQQNQQIREGIVARRNLHGVNSQQYQSHRAAAQAGIAYNNRQIEQERLLTREALRGRNTTLSGLQATHQAREREIAQLQRTAAQSKTAAEGMIRDNNQLVRQRQRLVGENQRLINSNTRQSAEEARAAQARIRHNESTIAGLNRRIRRNEGVIASNNRLAQTHQDAANKQIADARRVEESIQRQIAARQQLAQRMMMGGAAAMMMGAIMTGIGTKIVSSFANATRGAAEFQHGLALAHTQIDQTAGSSRAFGATVEDLSGIAMRVGRAVPAAMEEMPQTLFFIFTALNASLSEAESLLEGFAKEAVAGNASVEASARSTIAILNGMNMATSELTRIQDFQFQTVRKGVITYEQLSANIGKVIPPLRRMGQEVEVGGAMLAFLTRQGLSAEMAATSAARSLELFSDPRVIKRLEAQGVEMRNNAGEFSHFGVIINDLAEKFDGLTGPERAEEMREIFGGAGFRIQARRFLDTVFASEESLDHFNKQIEWATNNTGAFAEAFENMSQQPKVRLQELSNQFFVLRHQMGVALLPVMEDIIDGLKNVTDWFNNLSESSRANVVRMAAFAAAGIAVVGALTMMAGMMTVIVGMLVMMNVATGVAVAAVIGFIPAVAALAAVIGTLVYFGGDLRAMFSAIFGEFNGLEGVFKAAAIGLGFLTIALIAFNAASGVSIGSVGGIVAAIRGIVPAAKAASTALIGIAAANPILLALVAATGLAIAAWRIAGREARLMDEAVSNQTSALHDQIRTITDSADGFSKRNDVIRRAGKETAWAALQEKDLIEALDNSRVTRQEYLDGVVNTNNASMETRASLDAEIEAQKENVNWLEHSVSWLKLYHTEDKRRLDGMKELRDEYNRQNTAHQIAKQNMIDEMRAQDGLTAQVGEYMSLQQHSERANSVRAVQLREIIETTLRMTGALDDMSEAEINAMFAGEGLGEVLGDVDAAASAAAQAVSNLASVVSGMADPMSLYNDKLAEMNEAGRKMAEETASNTEDAASSWEDYYTEVEASAQAFFAAQEQQLEDQRNWFSNLNEIRERGHQEYADYLMSLGPEQAALVADINQQTEDEIARSAELQQQLLIENGEEQIRIWMRHGGQLIDEAGAISLEAVAAIEEQLDLAPGIIDAILNEGNILAEAQLNKMEEMFGIKARAGAEAMLEQFEWGSDELGIVMEAMEGVAEKGGAATITALARALGKGESEVVAILFSYANAMGNALNPMLDALGQTRIPGTNIISPIGRARAIITGGQNKGGFIPGGGPDRDSVLAPLTPGEFVLRRKAAQNLDPHALHELNRTGDIGAILRGYNAGGWVQPSDLPKPPTNYAPPVDPFTRPAHASADAAYERAKKWVSEQVPPLSEGVGWQAMWQAVNKVFGGRVNLHSALRPGAITATGNPSYHGMGRAIDITPDMGIFNWIKSNYGNSREIIYSPAGFGQVHNGRNHMYSGITRSMHWDHIHWAMANGGMGRVNEPTWFLAGESGPEDFAFAPAGGSRKVGDGPGIGANMDVLDAFMRNTSFQNATDFRMGGIQTIQSAFSALASYEEAQQALKDAYKEVDRLGKRSVQIASEIEQKELQLSQLAKNRVPSAQEELDILKAQQGVRQANLEIARIESGVLSANNELAQMNAKAAVRDAKWVLGEAQRGVHALNNELSELNQLTRVEDLREAFKQMQQGASEEELENLARNVESAALDLEKANAVYEEHAAALAHTQANVTKAQFELVVAMEIAPNLKRETDRLLAQYKAEAKLADAQSEHAEAQQQYTDSAEARKAAQDALRDSEDELTEARERGSATARELRVAEIELALAEEQLLKIQFERRHESEALRQAEINLINTEWSLKEAQEAVKHESEALKEAQWNLTVAQEGLTDAREASKAPTQEMLDLMQELDDLTVEQTENIEAQREARRNITKAELDAINATVGLIKAGQELADLTPSQLSFFNQIARQSGVATKSINDLNAAIGTLSGAGVQDPRTRLQKEIQDLFARYKVPLTYGTSETASTRVRRLADEILMGKRTMGDLERSVQIMAAQMQGISLKAVQAGMYDSGGVLRPGVTIATNNTGQNEFVFTADQLRDLGSGGKTVIVKIDEGSVQINVDGNVTEDALPELEEKIGKAFDEFKDDLYHTLSRY